VTPLTVIQDWADRAMVHMIMADQASAKYEKAKGRLKATPEYQGARDDLQRRMVEANWWMKDALATYNFHINEANRLHHAIIAQHALMWLAEKP
jgi:hypothetical protein